MTPKSARPSGVDRVFITTPPFFEWTLFWERTLSLAGARFLTVNSVFHQEFIREMPCGTAKWSVGGPAFRLVASRRCPECKDQMPLRFLVVRKLSVAIQ